jgi:hypothetical protein
MALSQLDAFMIPLIINDLGTAMAGMHVLAPFDASDGVLGADVAKQRAAYRATGPAVGQMVVDVEERLARSSLPPPPRPNTYAEYVLWSDAVIAAITSVVGPQDPAGALAALGRCVGELAQELGIREVVVRLQQVAPTNEALRAIAAQYAALSLKRVDWLDKLQLFATLPIIARSSAQRFAVISRRVVELEMVGVRPHDCEGIVNQIGAEIANLRGVLGG